MRPAAVALALAVLVAVASAKAGAPEPEVIAWMLEQDFGYCPPTQLHVAYAGTPSELTFSWYTTLPTKEPHVVVEYQDGSKGIFPASMDTYLPSAGWFYNATATGLAPEEEFHYYVGSVANGYSDSHHFYGPPTAGNRERTTTVASYGDMGIFQYAMPTVQAISKLAESNVIDFVLHAGDYGYGDDRSACYYEECWNLFFDQNLFTMQHVPYMAAAGNHEKHCGNDECDFYSNAFNVYRHRFHPPAAASNSSTNMWYSFQVANIHFVAIDTETDYPNSPDGAYFGDQLAWLEADLQAANANEDIDWIVAFGHRPWYVSSYDFTVLGHPENGYQYTQQAFEPLFHEYGVDLYIDGHCHAYERVYPTYDSNVYGNNTMHQYVNPPVTSYLVNGNAGNIEGFYGGWSVIKPEWSAFRYHEEHGYGIMDITGASKLTWSYWRSRDDGLVDYFEIIKTNSTADVGPATPPIHPSLRASQHSH